MSVVTMPSSGGLPQSHGSDENKGRRRIAGKGRNRSSRLENPRATHLGKSVSAVGTPLATPRKPLSVIDRNSRVPAVTPSQSVKGLLPQSTSKKPDRKHVPGGSAVKARQTSSQLAKGKRDVRTEDTISSAANDKLETFPDIETMSRRQEPDEPSNLGKNVASNPGPLSFRARSVTEEITTIAEERKAWLQAREECYTSPHQRVVSACREFVPPAYFNSLATALKRPLLPPLPYSSSVLSSLKLEPEIELRPANVAAVTPVECDQPYREELNLSVDLPDIDIW